MKLTEAIQLAKMRVFRERNIQAIVLLGELSHNRLSYIPVEASWASGLKGKVMGEVDSSGFRRII